MFDPYHKWLGIPKDQRPPNFYQLLGLAVGENDREVIEEAAIRQTTHVRAYQIGQYATECTRILNEVSQARQTLLNPAKKKEYDQKLAVKKASSTAIQAKPVNDFKMEDSSINIVPSRTSSTARPAAKHKQKTSGVPVPLILGLSGGGVVVVAGLIIFLLVGGGNPEPKPEPPKPKNPIVKVEEKKDPVEIVNNPVAVNLQDPQLQPLLGTWFAPPETNQGYLKVFTVAIQQNKLDVTSVVKKNNIEVGRSHAENVRFANGQLTYRQVYDVAPQPSWSNPSDIVIRANAPNLVLEWTKGAQRNVDTLRPIAQYVAVEPKQPSGTVNEQDPAVQAFLGSWVAKAKIANGYLQHFTISIKGGAFDIRSSLQLDGQEVGAGHSDNSSFENGELKFHETMDRLPTPGWNASSDITGRVVSGELRLDWVVRNNFRGVTVCTRPTALVNNPPAKTPGALPFDPAADRISGIGPAPHPDQVLVIGGKTMLVDLSNSSVLKTYFDSRNYSYFPPSTPGLSADGKSFVTRGQNTNELARFDLDSTAVVKKMSFPPPVFTFAVSRDGKTAAAFTVDRNLHLVDTENMREILQWSWPGKDLATHLDFSADSKYLVAATRTMLQVYDLATNKVILEKADAETGAVCFAPDNKKLVIVRRGELSTLDIKSGDITLFKALPFNSAFQVVAAPTGKHLAVAGASRKIYVLDWPTGNFVGAESEMLPDLAKALVIPAEGKYVYALLNREIRRVPLPDGVMVASKETAKEPTKKEMPAKKETPVAKQPVPTAEQIKEIETVLREDNKEDYAKKSAADKLALAEKLLDIAAQSKEDPIARYVLLREAKDLAVQANKAALALTIVDEIAQDYLIDALDLKKATLSAFSKGTLSTDGYSDLVQASLVAINEAVAQDQVPMVPQFLALADWAAKKANKLSLIGQVSRQEKEWKALSKEYVQMKASSEVLKKDPENAEANLVVGRYCSLRKGDWDQGLTMLAKAGENDLASAAAKDLSAPTETKEKLEVADLWWKLADSEKDSPWLQSSLKHRAGYWYRQAQDQASPLEQAKIQNRLKEIESSSSGIKSSDPYHLVRTIKAHNGPASMVQVSTDGKRILSSGADGAVRGFDLVSGRSIANFNAGMPLVGFAFSSNQQYLAAVGQGQVKVWDLTQSGGVKTVRSFGTKMAVPTMPAPRVSYNDTVPGAYFPGAENFFAPTNNGMHSNTVGKFGSRSTIASPGTTPFAGMQSSPNGSSFVFFGEEVRFGEPDNGGALIFPRMRQTLTQTETTAAAIAWDNQVAALGLKAAANIRIYDFKDRKDLQTLTGHTGPVRSLAFSPSGNRLASSSDDKTLRIWDLATGKEVHKFGVVGLTYSVAFSPDGRYLFAAGSDGAIRQWSLPKEKAKK